MRLKASFQRLRANRRGAAAAIVALALPVLVATMGVAIDQGIIQVRNSQLQTSADAAAAAGREAMVTSQDGLQPDATANAIAVAKMNMPTLNPSPSDFVQGWWNIKTKQFGGSFDGQVIDPATGKFKKFNNAIAVTVRETHDLIFGRLLGLASAVLNRSAIAYKCSNTDYPLSLVPDDPVPPTLPAFYASWATSTHPDPNTSYYYQDNSDPQHPKQHPVFKFYVPNDGDDVSFVIHDAQGHDYLQADSYCRGTFLVSPGDYDVTGLTGDLYLTIHYGDTNNSFHLDPNQSKHPFFLPDTTYYGGNKVPIPEELMPSNKVHVTVYPSANGPHNWASIGQPTPDRRAVIVE